MTLTLLPTAAFAADGETAALSPDTGGLCEHHTEHDEACGYMPQTEDAAGAPCGHMCEICRSENGGTDPAGPAGASGDTMPRQRIRASSSPVRSASGTMRAAEYTRAKTAW